MWAADRPYAEREWAEQCGGGVGGHLDPAMPPPTFARSEMRRGGSRITSTGISRMATGGRYPASQMPTLADMHGSVDTIGLYERYYNVLTASS